MKKIGIGIIVLSVLIWCFCFIMLFPDIHSARLAKNYIQNIKYELYVISIVMTLFFSFGIGLIYRKSTKRQERKNQDERK